MQTKRHWEECNFKPSYIAANNIALQLKEFAKDLGYDPRDVNVYNKEQARRHGKRADAIVLWKAGPVDWVNEIQLTKYTDIFIEKDINGELHIFDL